MNDNLYPENLIIGVCYAYTYHPSDWIPPPPNYNDNRRQSILTEKRFFYKNRDHQEINIDQFNVTIDQFPVSVRLTFQNGDLLNIIRSQDEDERADGSWMSFINKYNFQHCPNAAAAGGKRKKRKTKKQLIKLRNKKSKKRF
jgi:hypothetical protein